MLALYSDISDQLKFLILNEHSKDHPDNDFIIMDDLNEINSAFTTTSHLHVENERCTRLDSCQSPDQFFVNMVNEFLNDDTTTTLNEEPTKSSALNIEYLEESNENTVVGSIISFHGLNIATPKLSRGTETSTSQRSTTSPGGAAANNSSPLCSTKLHKNDLTTESTRSMNSLLLNPLNENLPTNVKEISYQRFGRFNTNLPAEVHNFKCHLCAFSCAWKEVLLQHFQDKHPT
ncbi:uncharacterized protein ACRADG_009389 [Cochliomyia hominivorax]